MIALMMPILTVFIYIVLTTGKMFYIYAWFFVILVSIVLMTIVPDYILPLFDVYRPLKEGVLKQKIENLAVSINYPLKKLLVVENSRRSHHSNAYMYGFYKNKCIVLFDTLFKNKTNVDDKIEFDENVKENEGQAGCTNDEICAILAHELGHWFYSHTLCNFVIGQIHMLFTFVVFAYFQNQSKMYISFGFKTQPTVIGFSIVFMIMSAFNQMLQIVLLKFSRKMEYSADEFSSKLNYSKNLQSALIKLHVNNLSNPYNDWLYSCCNFNHPTLLERLEALAKYDEKNK
ncbi:Prenyl protein-specific endoprotease 1 [Intoshia linei]|uniref:CAAX prenyl protease n=1 Tax=Intoshia linei TaxID=1819745 RepID=A0A177B022_9BILA|nr:Prenyl protein-specific endoprotease 1 [Intoshia linei]